MSFKKDEEAGGVPTFYQDKVRLGQSHPLVCFKFHNDIRFSLLSP